MKNIFEIERWGVLWIRLKALDGNGKKSRKSSREKTSLYASVSTTTVLERRRLVRATDKDEDRISFSFPLLGGLLIVFVRPIQVHGKQSFWLVYRLFRPRLVSMLLRWPIRKIICRFVTMTDRKYNKDNTHESIRRGAGYGSIGGYTGNAADLWWWRSEIISLGETYMNPFVSVQDMDQSEDKLQICVTMTDGDYHIITGNTHESIRFGTLAGYGS